MTIKPKEKGRGIAGPGSEGRTRTILKPKEKGRGLIAVCSSSMRRSLLAVLALVIGSQGSTSVTSRRLLIIEGIQEQTMCAFKAFDEYLKDIATITNR